MDAVGLPVLIWNYNFASSLTTVGIAGGGVPCQDESLVKLFLRDIASYYGVRCLHQGVGLIEACPLR